MNPEDFIDLADQLAADPAASAATMRTAASRAYYGAYLFAREILLVAWRQARLFGGNEHKALQICFLNCGVPEGFVIGKLLESLHQSRREADYDLHLHHPGTQVNALFCVARAREIVSQLNQVNAGATGLQIRAGISQYRRTTNQ
jgi:uncharacterized protein (UPF0332 family)